MLIGHTASGPRRAELDHLETEHAAATETVSDLSAEIDELESEVTELHDQIDERDAIIEEIDDREAELDDREASLDDREAELDGFESDLEEREEAVTQTEAEVEANTIDGDGIWVVGEEIEPGIYKAQGSGSACYWARLDSLDTFDIINNHFGSAKVTVEIRSSDTAFETSGCGSWLKQ
ncbi:hypothetical protein GCM10027447_00390 [Glycomyces halotolerans]